MRSLNVTIVVVEANLPPSFAWTDGFCNNACRLKCNFHFSKYPRAFTLCFDHCVAKCSRFFSYVLRRETW
jgi:hypothetical protein